MKLQNKPKILAATRNYSGDKMFTVMCDIPYCLLEYFLRFKELNITYKKIEDIELQEILNNPFIPIWTKQQKGMSGELITDKNKIEFYNNTWKGNLQMFVDYGIENYTSGEQVHKQNTNRLLAPFAYTTCIISSTEWDNFFEMLCPKYEFARYNEQGNEITHYEYAKSKKEHIRQIGVTKLEITPETYYEEYWNRVNKSSAQPEFQVIAEMLYDLYQEANWKESKYHIPFEDDIDIEVLKEYLHKNHKTYELDQLDSEHILNQFLMLISASMCAKLSYNTQDNEDTIEKHLERANMLIESKHYEPFSHQAIAMDEEKMDMFTKTRLVSIEKVNGDYNHINSLDGKQQIIEKGVCYNLKGFISQRYILENYE